MREENLQISLIHEHRFKNPEQNISKSNIGMCMLYIMYMYIYINRYIYISIK